MNILAIETSGCMASVALLEDNQLLASRSFRAKRTHSQCILPMVRGIMQEAAMPFDSLDCLAASIGPGSYTGVRIGIGVTAGLSMGLNIPCVGVSSLASIAFSYPLRAGDTILVAMKARADALYFATFQADSNAIPRRIDDDKVADITTLKQHIETLSTELIVAGDGAVCVGYPASILNESTAFGVARAVALGGYTLSSPQQLQAVYLNPKW